MGRKSSMRKQSLAEIGGRTATEDERQWFLFVSLCMFVTLDVQERGPDIQQRIMSPFVDQFQCGFQCFTESKGFLTVCRNFNYGPTIFDEIGENNQKLTEKFVSTT